MNSERHVLYKPPPFNEVVETPTPLDAEPPFPARHRTDVIQETIRQWSHLSRGEDAGRVISASGLVVSRYQEAGRLAFWMLNDGSAELQVALTARLLGGKQFVAGLAVSEGERIEVTGQIGRTRRGMLSIQADHWQRVV